MPKSKKPKLTLKQSKFIEAFSGNGTEAARLAGYKGSDNTLAQAARDNLRNPQIADAIKKRENKIVSKLIATRAQRQEFWTEVLNSKFHKMQDRLRASELLGKSEADFTDKLQHTGKDGDSIKVVVTLPANGSEKL